jgi:hypothetical protein
LSLAKTCTLIPNDAFNIKKSYDAIDFQNGQIYVMCKTVGEFGLDNGRVLIYPPLTAAAADPDVSNDTVITIPIDQDQASSSSSSSISVKRQPTEAEGFHDDTDVIIDVGYCGEEEEDSL